MYKNKLPGGVRFLLGFLSVLLCIVLFVASVAAILVVDVQTITNKDNLQEIINQAFFPNKKARVVPNLSGMDLGGLLGDIGDLGDLGDLAGYLSDSALVDSIYEMIQEQAGGEATITKEQVGQVIQESTLPEFLSEKVSSVVSDVFTGESTTTITTEEVVKLLEDNAPLLKEHFDIEIDESQIEVVETWLEENDIVGTVKQEINSALGILAPELPEGGILGGSNTAGSLWDLFDPNFSAPENPAEVLQLVRSVTSQETLWILLGLCGAIFLLLFFTHWGRPFAAVRSAGIPVMIAGLFMMLPTAVVSFLPAEFPLAGLLQSLFSATGNVSLIVAAIGFVMILAGAILNSVCKNAAARKALAAAEPTIEEQLLSVDAE